MVISFKNFEILNDENYLQLVLELENLTERKIVKQRYNQMLFTLDSIFQKYLRNLDREPLKKRLSYHRVCKTFFFL